ncbi:MAG TPA: hypothetical protein VII27_04180 [Thermoplasmata archaeon]
MGIGLVWFAIPNVYTFGTTSGYMVEYPNWRGLPFMALAVVLSIVAIVFTRRELLKKARHDVSLGLLIAGLALTVAGIVWFFTPDVEAYGDAVMIGYPNAGGLPFIAFSAVLWVLAGLELRYRHLGTSRAPLAIGLLVAGLISLAVADLAFFLLDIGLAKAAVIPQGTVLFQRYPLIPPTALWLIAALVLWLAHREEWRSLTRREGSTDRLRPGTPGWLRTPRRPRGR